MVGMDYLEAMAEVERWVPLVGQAGVGDRLLDVIAEVDDTAPLELLFQRLAERNDAAGWALLCRATPSDEHEYHHAYDGLLAGRGRDEEYRQRARRCLEALRADPDHDIARAAEDFLDDLTE